LTTVCARFIRDRSRQENACHGCHLVILQSPATRAKKVVGWCSHASDDVPANSIGE
jgi:hypothetical protein